MKVLNPQRFFPGLGGNSTFRRTTLILLVALLTVCSNGNFWQEAHAGSAVQAPTPPRGWNSYDSFSWLVTEQEFLENAQFVSEHLLEYGYEYVVVDYLWYRKNESGATFEEGEDIVDEWGRLQPDPVRWPSSLGGCGFTKVAQKVHSLGLKFGIHVMRGISLAAVNKSTPILGGEGATAQDVALLEDKCAWMPKSFVGVNTTLPAGRSFIFSLYDQFAEWGVDFVKHDCVFGNDLQLDEIKTVSKAIEVIGRPIYYSLSPGVGSTTNMGEQIGQFVNLYRVTGDTWDNWTTITSHFNIARDFAKAKLQGAQGLQGLSWPDLDMLPLGLLTDPGSLQGPHRLCGLNDIEQQTMVTLWAIAKSPLFYGGDLRVINQTTFDLITNKLVLDINSKSIGNIELVDFDEKSVWIASGSNSDADEIFVALFNLANTTSQSIIISIEEIIYALKHENTTSSIAWQCTGIDNWTQQNLQVATQDIIFPSLPPHASVFYTFNCNCNL